MVSEIFNSLVLKNSVSESTHSFPYKGLLVFEIGRKNGLTFRSNFPIFKSTTWEAPFLGAHLLSYTLMPKKRIAPHNDSIVVVINRRMTMATVVKNVDKGSGCRGTTAAPERMPHVTPLWYAGKTLV